MRLESVEIMGGDSVRNRPRSVDILSVRLDVYATSISLSIWAADHGWY